MVTHVTNNMALRGLSWLSPFGFLLFVCPYVFSLNPLLPLSTTCHCPRPRPCHGPGSRYRIGVLDPMPGGGCKVFPDLLTNVAATVVPGAEKSLHLTSTTQDGRVNHRQSVAPVLGLVLSTKDTAARSPTALYCATLARDTNTETPIGNVLLRPLDLDSALLHGPAARHH